MHRPDDGFYHDHGDGILHCHEVKPCDDISRSTRRMSIRITTIRIRTLKARP